MQANLRTEAGQAAHYAAIKAKLYGRPANVNIKAQPTIQPQPVFAVPRPDADAHVVAYRAWRKMAVAGTTIPVFVRCFCVVNGVTMSQIRERKKSARILEARRKLATALRDKYRISMSHIGRIIGRDHTTVYNLLGRPGNGRGAVLSREDVYEIRALYDAGHPARVAAAKYNVAISTINYIGRRKRWRHLPEVCGPYRQAAE